MNQRPPAVIVAHYRARYSHARLNKIKKSEIIDEFRKHYSYNRKAAIRLLNGIEQDTYGMARPGRPSRYQQKELLMVLKAIWLASDQMCSQKLQAAIPIWLPYYEVHHQPLTEDIRGLLLKISSATIDRLLRPYRANHKRKRYCGTRPGSLLRNQIPIQTTHWNVIEPGFVEADTVAHCGTSLAGNFVWSLTITDIYSGWTEIRATWNKGCSGVIEQIEAIEKNLPFELKGFDCDNGSEFLNHHLVRYFTEHKNKIEFTRSRPYKKNDNAHVEQKNWTHVRQLFHYHRIDNPRVVKLMNALYAKEWSLLQNYFCPTLKLKEKVKINSRYIKRYEKAETPYQRLLSSEAISAEQKNRLKKVNQLLDPYELRVQIEKQLKIIFKYVRVTPIMIQRP